MITIEKNFTNGHKGIFHHANPKKHEHENIVQWNPGFGNRKQRRAEARTNKKVIRKLYGPNVDPSLVDDNTVMKVIDAVYATPDSKRPMRQGWLFRVRRHEALLAKLGAY